MACGPTCACLGTDVECLSVLDPARFGYFRDWCAGTDEARRRCVLDRSRIGLNPPPAPAPTPMRPPAPPDPLAGIPLAGDVVEAIARRIGADRLAAWWTRKTGRPCGCADRREKMNAATITLLKWAGLQ